MSSRVVSLSMSDDVLAKVEHVTSELRFVLVEVNNGGRNGCARCVFDLASQCGRCSKNTHFEIRQEAQ